MVPLTLTEPLHDSPVLSCQSILTCTPILQNVFSASGSHWGNIFLFFSSSLTSSSQLRNRCENSARTVGLVGIRSPCSTENAEKLKFSGSAANANCALRTLRRMLHKAEEWKLIARAPKIKLMIKHWRDITLDADAEEKLVQASVRCKWRTRTRELFRDIIALMCDSGMRNERELFRMRVEDLDWNNRTIFVPDSMTAEGRRLVPMSSRVFEILKKRCGTRTDGWVFPCKRSASGHLRSICNLFRQTRNEAQDFQRNWCCTVRGRTTARGF